MRHARADEARARVRARKAAERRAAEAAAREHLEASLASLREADPGFDRGVFESRVVRAFTEIQAAWSEADLSPIRHYVSDGVFNRFDTYGDAEAWYALVDVGVGDVDLKRVSASQRIGAVKARLQLRWSGAIARCSAAGVEAVEATIQPRQDGFDLVRARAPEGPSRGLASAGCARCGGPLARTDQSSCPWCEAPIEAGEADWLLEDIDFLTEPVMDLVNRRRADAKREREALRELSRRRRERRR